MHINNIGQISSLASHCSLISKTLESLDKCVVTVNQNKEFGQKKVVHIIALFVVDGIFFFCFVLNTKRGQYSKPDALAKPDSLCSHLLILLLVLIAQSSRTKIIRCGMSDCTCYLKWRVLP